MDKEKLTAALDKKAMYGNDIDLNAYNDTNEARTKSVDELSQATRDRLEYVGIETGAAEEENRSASFVQLDNNAVEVKVKKQTPLELMSTGKAAEKYPELVEKYWWKAVKPDTDKYTAKTALEQEQGYFIRVRAGQKITTPLQACMCISHDQQLQHVHNVIIIEDGAELSIISGCTSAHEVESGMHIGISEMYIGKNAKLSFTMIHSWGENVIVRPRTVALVEEGGQYISNYVSIEKAKDVQMYPTVHLNGRDAEGCKAESITRTISTGGEVINRGCMTGKVEGIRAHLECDGLMLSNKGYIYAIPELDAQTGNAEMSHEAAVGRINPEEIEYLMARGMSEDDATATIVRGFLNVNIEGLPDSLAKKIEATLDSFKYNKGM